MVFVDFAILGVLVGLAFDGRLSHLADVQIRGLPLAYAAFGLQVLAFPSGVLPWSISGNVARVLWLVSYALQITLILRNRHLRGVAIVGLGLACNLVAILANGGLMPVTQGALRAAGLTYKVHNNSISTAKPHLAWLVDRWAAPHGLPLANVFSVGDVLIAIGTVLAITLAMRAPASRVLVAGGWRLRFGVPPAPRPNTGPRGADLSDVQAEAAALTRRFELVLAEAGISPTRL
jgi:uncharacterized protein DUF5317